MNWGFPHGFSAVMAKVPLRLDPADRQQVNGASAMMDDRDRAVEDVINDLLAKVESLEARVTALEP